MSLVIVIAFALCNVVLFYAVVRHRRKRAGQSLRPVNLKAFRALMVWDNELFLRKKLSRSQFSRLKRRRIRLTMRYVAWIAGNASVVRRIGESMRLSSTPEMADTATEVMKLTRQVRLQCLLAMGKLLAKYAIP